MSTDNNGAMPSISTGEYQEGGSENNITKNNQQSTTKTNSRRSVRTKDESLNDTNTFKGETSKMNGHVFLTHAERKDKIQLEI